MKRIKRKTGNYYFIYRNGKFYEKRLKAILEREKIKSEVYSQAKKEMEQNVLFNRTSYDLREMEDLEES